MAKKMDFKAAFEEQRAAGVDIADPINNLIAKPGQKKRTAAPKAKAPVGKLKDFIPASAGKRTKRVQIVMTPELYERTKAAADNAGISFNELINQVCDKITQ